MEGRYAQHLQSHEVRKRAGWGLAAIMLLILSGCATGGITESETTGGHVREERGSHAAAGGAVSEEGFTIRETHSLEAETIRDFERAVTLIKKEDYAEAAELLELVIAESPGVTAPYVNAAIAYVHLGKMARAEEHLQTALDLFPGHPAASNEYGLLLRSTGRFAEARVIYEKCLAMFPEYRPARKNLGILCDLYLKDPACALKHYEIYHATVPHEEEVQLWIADLRMRLGQ